VGVHCIHLVRDRVSGGLFWTR